MDPTTTQMTTTPVTVILTTHADWDEWIEVIKTMARGKDIWEYVNPKTPKRSLPILTPPELPTIQSISEDAESYSSLSATNREFYRLERQSYHQDRTEYLETKKNLVNFCTRIQQLVSRQNLSITFKCDTPYDMLVKLHDRFAPTDQTREQEMIARYHRLLKAPKGRNLETWLQQWKKTYSDAVEMNLPEVAGS